MTDTSSKPMKPKTTQPRVRVFEALERRNGRIVNKGGVHKTFARLNPDLGKPGCLTPTLKSMEAEGWIALDSVQSSVTGRTITDVLLIDVPARFRAKIKAERQRLGAELPQKPASKAPRRPRTPAPITKSPDLAAALAERDERIVQLTADLKRERMLTDTLMATMAGRR